MQDSPTPEHAAHSRKGKERQAPQPTDIAEKLVALRRRQAGYVLRSRISCAPYAYACGCFRRRRIYQSDQTQGADRPSTRTVDLDTKTFRTSVLTAAHKRATRNEPKHRRLPGQPPPQRRA